LQVTKDARYHERRATYVAAERRKDSDRLKVLTQELERAKETTAAMVAELERLQPLRQQLQEAEEARRSVEQDQSAWKEQQLQTLQKEFHEELNKRWQELQRQNQAQTNTASEQNDDTEMQMVEQVLQYEREVESLRGSNEQLVGDLCLVTYKELRRTPFRKERKLIWLRRSKRRW
jgi:hypothetical protein